MIYICIHWSAEEEQERSVFDFFFFLIRKANIVDDGVQWLQAATGRISQFLLCSHSCSFRIHSFIYLFAKRKSFRFHLRPCAPLLFCPNSLSHSLVCFSRSMQKKRMVRKKTYCFLTRARRHHHHHHGRRHRSRRQIKRISFVFIISQ